MNNVRPAPLFSLTDYIYPGPHLDKEGKIDDRIWFAILVKRDSDTGQDTYIVFPMGGTESEISEIVSEGLSHG